jgi:hypothetical protein
MRFLCFAISEIRMDSIDIPFSSIFEDPSAAPEVPKDECSTMGNPFIILWDGRDIVPYVRKRQCALGTVFDSQLKSVKTS